MLSTQRCIVLFCACIPTGVCASNSNTEEQPWDWLLDPQPLPSSLSIFVGGGEDDYRDLFASADLNTFYNMRLLASYNESSQNNDGSDNLQTRGYALGISSDPVKDVVVQLQGEYWGQENMLETYRAGLELRYQAMNWSAQLTLQQRDITILSDTRIQREVDVEDTSTGLGLNLYWPENWHFDASYTYHDYDKDLSALERPLLQLAFSPIALSLAYGLEKTRLSFGIGYTWNDTSFGIDRTRSTSVVDDSVSYANEIYASQYWQSWQAHLRLGRQSYDSTDDTSNFINIGVSYIF